MSFYHPPFFLRYLRFFLAFVGEIMYNAPCPLRGSVPLNKLEKHDDQNSQGQGWQGNLVQVGVYVRLCRVLRGVRGRFATTSEYE